MSATNVKPGPASKPGQGGLQAIAPNNQSLLLDKLNVRRSTPDSEALASSDEEPDSHRQDHAAAAQQPLQQQQLQLQQKQPQPPQQPQPTQQPQQPQHNPARRASWLNDTSQAIPYQPRKGSFASSNMSPTASHPSTPSVEVVATPWGSNSVHSNTLGRSHQAPPSFTWGTGIWNTDRSKEPPSRLSEVLPSPTSTIPGNASLFADTQTSPGPRDPGSNSQIPFAIPLHPTPKTYRSQSYSVGQLDPDANPASVPPSTMMAGRGGRPIGHPGLQHRPSRPSMLSEMSNDGAMLGKVKEVEDDDDQSNHSPGHGSHPQQTAESKTIEMLARENALLRQQQYQNSRVRARASTGAAYGLGNGYNVHEPVPEESEYAIDELDESSHDGHEAAVRRAMGRRMSEFGVGVGPSIYGNRSPYSVDNRKLDSVKNALWKTSLGFGGLADIPQSRRHSFADVPTRQGSIGSIGEPVAYRDTASPEASQPQDFGGFAEGAAYSTTSPVSYLNPNNNMASAHQAMASSAYGNPYPSPYGGLPTAYANRAPSPHRNMYGMNQPRHNQLLYIVLFKCSRADVFYIQEGTGLTVKPGDLVIVEADRGTDLGTVDRSEVDWQTAKELKEHYAEEHYKWLMMYSQNAAAAQEGTGAGLMAASNGMQGSAIGGMGPPNQHHVQEPNAGELKPKLIKRLAQAHEIQNLREKEGNEAKAKRVCMQKVKEHGLNMEILDAEFQMDWKKLTFYYFADAYINFNSLVTDLFKIYKTRIWMSAINPASFMSPTLGLQAPSGIGPGAVRGGNAAAVGTERRQNQTQEQQNNFSGGNASQRQPQYQPAFAQTFTSERPAAPGGGYPPSAYPYSGYGAFGGSRTGAVPLVPTMMGMDAYPSGYTQGADFQGMRARFPSPHGAPVSHDATASVIPGQNDWVGAFQGLSLNSR